MNKIPDHIIIYDGECVMCNRLVRFVVKRDKRNQFYFAHLQSEMGKRLKKQLPEADTFIYVQNGKVYTKSSAALKVCGQLSGPLRFLHPFVYLPGLFRDPVYHIVSYFRYKWFGKFDKCRLPDENLRKRFLS